MLQTSTPKADSKKRTRYQPKALYTAALCLFTVSALAAIYDDECMEWLGSVNEFLSGPSPIHWYKRADALQVSMKSHKPVLYMFLARRDFSAIRIIGEGLHDREVARIINDNYVPVRVDYDPKKTNDSLKEYSDQYYPNNGTSLVVVPSTMLTAKNQDLTSSANPSELGICDLGVLERGEYYGSNCYYGWNSDYTPQGFFGRRGPIMNGYRSKQDLVEFLASGLLWHRLPPTLGKVDWQPQSTLAKPIGARRRLIAFVEDYGQSSDSMRLQLFWHKRAVGLINNNFEPVLVQYRNSDGLSSDPALNALKEKYGITNLPALVIDDGKNPPAVQFGHNNVDSTISYLSQGFVLQEVRLPSGEYVPMLIDSKKFGNAPHSAVKIIKPWSAQPNCRRD